MKKIIFAAVTLAIGFGRADYVVNSSSCKFDGGYPTLQASIGYVGAIGDESKPNRDYLFEVVAESAEGRSRGYQQFFGRDPRELSVSATENLVYVHGKVRVFGFLTDKETGEKLMVHDAVYERPDYLEIVLPSGGVVTTDRQSAAVRLGIRINDEPHFVPDAVKVRVLAPNGNEHWAGEVPVMATETTVWTEIPFANKSENVGDFRIEAETMRDGDRPVCVVRTLNVVETPHYAIDQDGMAIVDGVRRMTFVSDDEGAKDFKCVAMFALNEREAMTCEFARRIVTARKLKPNDALSCVIEIGNGTGDSATDSRMLRGLAHLALVSGANAVIWRKNMLKDVTDGVEREIAALGPEALVPSTTIVSMDGFVFARLFGNTVICVNTERFVAHESVLKSKRLPGGSLKLLLEPDAMCVMEVAAASAPMVK